MNNFSATECIRFGWETFKKRGWFLVGVTALMLVVSWLIGGVVGGIFGADESLGFLAFVANFALSTLLSMGFTHVMLRSHDSLETAEVKDLWHPRPFWNYFFVQLIVGITVFLGFLLLIVPGIFAALVFFFVLYLVIDKGLGPIEAMKESARITKGNRMQLLLLALIVALLNILGLVALLIGALVTIPVTTLAIVHAYRTLERKVQSAAV